MTIRHGFAAIIALCVFGCGDDSAVWPGHERPPAITVRLVPASGPPTTAPVQYIRAPDVEFDAVIQPDFNHPTAVTAPEAGRVTRRRENGLVGPGDTLVWLERVPGRETMGPLAAAATTRVAGPRVWNLESRYGSATCSAWCRVGGRRLPSV